MRPLIRIAVAFAFFSAMSLSAHGQVVLRLNSRHFSSYEPIKVVVTNQQSRPVSVCVSQQWIPKPNDDVGVATTPLLLQVQNGGKWVTVLNGVDVGPPLRYPPTIESRKPQEFQLQTNGSGKARFVLYYGTETIPPPAIVRLGRKAISPTFTLAAHE